MDVARSPAADGDEIVVSGELLDHALGETQVAVQRHDHALPDRLNLPDRERILNHVGVADEHDRVCLRRFFQAWFGRRFFFRLSVRQDLARGFGFPSGKAVLNLPVNRIASGYSVSLELKLLAICSPPNGAIIGLD